MTKPLYIFDLDGTLADVGHRRHILEDAADSHRWRKFYAACVHDKPNRSVAYTLYLLIRSLEVDVWIWSGRSDEVRKETEDWLNLHFGFPSLIANLRMRGAKDHRPDDVLKLEWYDSLSQHDRDRLVAVFDDRDRMVSMWRNMGVACFQVAPGDF